MGIQDWRQNINDDQDLTPNGKLVAYTLANYYRVGFETFPSISSLEISTNLSKNTILRSIKELEELEHIKVAKKIRRNRSQKQNHYEFIGATIEPVNEPVNERANEPVIKRANERSIIAPEIRRNKKNLEEKKKDTNVSKKESVDFSILQLTEDQLKDFKEIRKKTKATNTQRSINAISQEFEKARNKGYSNEQIIQAMHEKGWRGFKADWLDNLQAKELNNGPNQQPEQETSDFKRRYNSLSREQQREFEKRYLEQLRLSRYK